jgi:hypothetical protein
MAVPHTFESGEIASSAEVNENFNHVDGVLGTDSTSSELNLPGNVVMSPRDTIQLSAAADTAYGDNTFIQLSWNAELYDSGGGTWKVRRINDGEESAGVRIGSGSDKADSAIEFWLSARTDGELNSQFTRVGAFQARLNGDDTFYLWDGMRMSRVATNPASIQDYRLTYTPFANPVTIYDGVYLKTGRITRRATDYGVPAEAVAVQLSAYVTATAGSGAGLKLMQAEASPSIGTGFVVHAYGGPYSYYGRSGGEGIVHLGTSGSYDGRFYEQRTAVFSTGSLFIKGFWM